MEQATSQPTSFNTHQHVTAVISHRVKPGREEGYEEWLKGIAAAARQFEGHLGSSILRPKPGAMPDYVIVVKFDTCGHLQTWLRSDIRHDWIDRAVPLIREPESIQVLEGLEAWFYLPETPMKTPPPRRKMVVVTWIGVFFTTWLLGHLLKPLRENDTLPFLLIHLFSTGLTVILLTYFVMPNLTRLFHKWLHPQVAKAS